MLLILRLLGNVVKREGYDFPWFVSVILAKGKQAVVAFGERPCVDYSYVV
jgi:hypothetical protein